MSCTWVAHGLHMHLGSVVFGSLITSYALTQGPPNEVNCHPHLSTPDAEFTVVHNGIITNCRDLRALLERKGCVFVSETDTESIAKLVKFVYDKKLAASDGEK